MLKLMGKVVGKSYGSSSYIVQTEGTTVLLLANACSEEANLYSANLDLELEFKFLLCDAALTSSPYSSSVLE
ncbi:hypothetical protein SUGI_0559290 [Cryptomeria japonica]|nr:hypothetical protein SUGI_0559290 [Cryptomeria japonica]